MSFWSSSTLAFKAIAITALTITRNLKPFVDDLLPIEYRSSTWNSRSESFRGRLNLRPSWLFAVVGSVFRIQLTHRHGEWDLSFRSEFGTERDPLHSTCWRTPCTPTNPSRSKWRDSQTPRTAPIEIKPDTLIEGVDHLAWHRPWAHRRLVHRRRANDQTSSFPWFISPAASLKKFHAGDVMVTQT
jgi:hypothetical protein